MLADELEGTTSRDLNSISTLDVRTEIHRSRLLVAT